MFDLVLLIQIAATGLLTGLIWTIQVVHYPLFAAVGAEEFVDYQTNHARRITTVVGPLMLVEALTAIVFVGIRPDVIPDWIPWTGLALVAVIWLSTAIVQIPCHARLARGFDPDLHRRLVRSNWIRTFAWTARTSVLLRAGWLALQG
jgi:hypothetical protein